MENTGIVNIFYILIVLIAVVQNATDIAPLDIPKSNKIISLIIVIIFAPAIVAANIAEALLNFVIPEDDDNERKL